MTTKRDGNGLERWRGETTAKLEGLTKLVEVGIQEIKEALVAHGNDDSTRFARIDKRLNALEPRVAGITAKVALVIGLGASLGAGATTYILHRLIG